MENAGKECICLCTCLSNLIGQARSSVKGIEVQNQKEREKERYIDEVVEKNQGYSGF